MARKTLYLIDGHAQIYRAYYAPFAPLNSQTGEPTRAVHVFMQMLLGLLRNRRPDYLAMTMDTADETVFRVQIDPTYKANREKMPEDLPLQIERIVAILQAMGVPVLRTLIPRAQEASVVSVAAVPRPISPLLVNRS